MTSSECHLKGDFVIHFKSCARQTVYGSRSWQVLMRETLLWRGNMYKNRASSGKNNISGDNIARIRKQLTHKVSQRFLADRMQLEGIELDKNAIQRIESGARFITDIELKAFAKVLAVSYEELLEE